MYSFLLQGKANHYKGERELETMKNVDRSASSDQLLKIVNGNHQVFSRSLNNDLEATGRVL